MKKMILTFSLKEEQKRAVTLIGRKMGIQIREVAPADYGRTLGALCDLPQADKRVQVQREAKAFPKEMLVFSGLDSKGLDRFLAEYRKTDLGKIDLKAMVTPTNAGWTPVQLFFELMREHITILAR